MNKKIIIWSFAFFFLILLTDFAAAVLNDNIVNGSKAVNRNVVITKNGRVLVSMIWTEGSATNDPKAKTWLEYAANSTGGDESDAGTQITDSCGSNAFLVVNRSVSCPDSDAHCVLDPTTAYKINVSTVAAATNQRFMWGIKSCNVSGVFDIGTDRDLSAGTVTLNNWFNITVAQTLFRAPAGVPASADRGTYYANTTTPAANQTVNLSVRITNEEDIKFHIFSTNLTGTWRNRSASNVRVSGAADTNIVNWTTLDMNTTCVACSNTQGIGWRIFANDSSRMHNASALNMLYPQAVVTDSCTPPGSGDWVITDVCYKSNTKIALSGAGAKVIINSGGLLICDRGTNITNNGKTANFTILGAAAIKMVIRGASNC